MNRKMSGKQTVDGALSLDEFITGADTVRTEEQPVSTTEPAGRVGAPRKPKSEARSKVVQITLTASELGDLKRKANGVPLSVYVRSVLKDGGILS